MTRTLAGLGVCQLFLCVGSCVASGEEPAVETFAFPLSDAIHNEADFGIVNGKVSVGVNYKHLADIEGLFAPPLVSSDFRFTVSVNGEALETSSDAGGLWVPNAVHSTYRSETYIASCDTLLPYDERALAITLAITPNGPSPIDLTLAGAVSGTLDVNQIWEFARPSSSTAVTPSLDGGILLLAQGENVLAIGASPPVDWDVGKRAWRSVVHMAESRPFTQRFIIACGTRADAALTCRRLMDQGALGNEKLAERCTQYLSRLPRFECDNAAFQKLYYRSLAHGLLNRWDVPEFKLHPYYSTGSIKGGCLCCYLWDFGEVWEIMPLFDPEASKTHIKQFLSIDLTKHFAFLPIAGESFGPWYMVNQEKIIGLVYYYVMETGEKAFLSDTVDGRTILDHVIEHATFGDDLGKPVALIDYGDSNSHLELRKALTYNHVMPDLNGRRYNNYVFAARLSELMGKPRPDLLQRAEDLRKVLHDELWDPQAKWFAFRNKDGEKELRWTCQEFKLFNSPVLTDESLQGLLSHWNTNEFLGDYGLHSLAKDDPAYDENDVDNGGPGACTCFPPQIMERLYKSGHATEADELLKRVLWWGEKLPYWGDSLYADHADYRKDTPLQCAIDGLTVAQMTIFGLFGITPHTDGSITVNPHLPSFAKTMALRHVTLRGHHFDMMVTGDSYSIEEDGKTLASPMGTETTLAPR